MDIGKINSNPNLSDYLYSKNNLIETQNSEQVNLLEIMDLEKKKKDLSEKIYSNDYTITDKLEINQHLSKLNKTINAAKSFDDNSEINLEDINKLSASYEQFIEKLNNRFRELDTENINNIYSTENINNLQLSNL